MPDNPTIPEGFELEAPRAPAAPLPEPEADPNRARYVPIALRAADSFGVPRSLFLWQIGQESNWNPNARNPAPGTHATGIAQFQPGTAKQFGLDPLNPEDSLYAAARYMRELHDKTGDWTSALRHYGTVGDDSPASVKQAAESVTPEVPAGFQVESAIPEGFEVEHPPEPAQTPLAPMPRLQMETALTPAEAWRRGQKFAERGINNLQQFVEGSANPGNITGEGAIIEPPAQSANLQQAREQGGKQAVEAGPLLPVSEFAPNPGFIHGSLQSAEGFTSPTNLEIIAGTMGAGSSAAALRGYPLVAARALQATLGAYFTDQIAQGTGAAMDRAIAAYKKGDLEGVKENLGFASVQALMAGFGIYHAASGTQGVLSTEVPKLPATPTNRWSVGHSGGFEPGQTPEIAKDLPVSGPPAAPEPGPGPTIDVQAEPGDKSSPPPADVPPGVPPSETALPTGFQVESQPEAAPPLSTQLPAEAETGKANENKSPDASAPDWFKPGLASDGEPIRKEGDQTIVSGVRWQRTPGTPEVNPQGATFFSIANPAGQDSHSTYAGKEPAAIHWGGEHQVAGDISFSNPLELPTEKQGKYNLPLPEQIIRTLAGPVAADFDRHYSMETQLQKFGVARGRGFLDQEAELESRLGIPPGTIADARQGPPGQIANSVAIALLRRDGYDGAIGKPAAPTDLAEAVRLTPLAPQAQDDALPKAAHQAPAVASTSEPDQFQRPPFADAERAIAERYEGWPERHRDAHARPADPKLGDIFKFGNRERVLVHLWRTASAKAADGKLHVTFLHPVHPAEPERGAVRLGQDGLTKGDKPIGNVFTERGLPIPEHPTTATGSPAEPVERKNELNEKSPAPEAETPAKKPQGLPFAAAEAVKELKGIWENALKFGEQGAQHQIRVYSDKSPAAVEEARQNGIEHGLSFSRDREAGLIEKLNQFRELARSKGLDPEEYLRDAGLPVRWLNFAEKTGYSRERPETLLNDKALQRKISDPLLPRAKREAGEDAIRLAHEIEAAKEKGSPAAQVEAQRQILREHLQNIEAAEETPAPETLSYRAKGNHKADIRVWQDDAGKWHGESDYNLQGQMGGSGGFAEALDSRAEAIAESTKMARRHLEQYIRQNDTATGRAPKVRDAKLLLGWLTKQAGADETPAPSIKIPALAPDTSREPRGASLYGDDTNVPVPGSDTTYPARYAVRELSDVAPSHNGESFEDNPAYEHRNDRDYKKPENAERVVRQAAAFDPAYLLTDNHDSLNGPPITDPRGNVLGGNSRAMTIQRVYALRPEAAQNYRELLEAKAPAFGIDRAEVRKLKQPVLVREMTPEKPQDAITDFNKVGTAPLLPAERAIADSRRVSPDTLDYLSFQIAEQGEDGTLAQVLGGSKGPQVINRLVDDGVITAQERPHYITSKGIVTAEGKQRITQLMVGRLFDSPAEFDATAPELRNKLEKIVGPLARVEVNPEWSLTEQTREAVAILNDARQHGIKNLDDLERQDTIFDKDLSDDPLAIARLIHAGQVKAAAAFRQYAADFEVFQRAQEGHAFDFLTPPTPREAFESAFLEKPPAEPMLSRELVRVAPDRGKTYTPDELYRDVDAEPLPATATRPARLRVNWQAGRFIAIAMRSGHFSGALIPAGHMNFVAQRVHDYAKQLWAGEAIELETFQQLENLADSLFEVAKLAQGNPAIIYRSDFGDYPIPGMPVAGVMGAIRMRAETMREELTHQQQHVFARGENSTAHLTLAMRDYVMKDPAWPQIYKMLHDPGQGYEQFSHEQIILEAAAKIAAGRAESELNLTPRDAIRWLKRYEQGLIETHGLVPAGEVFRFADPGIKSKLELAHAEDPHARERGDRAPESGSRNGRNQDGETGPAAEPGAPTRKSRATDEAAQRRGRARDDEGLRSLGGEDLSLFDDDETQDIAESAARDRDQLEGQRLTAQLNAPLTRDEQLKKLKRTKEDPAAGPQSDFFEAPPDKPQGSLFSKSKDDGAKASGVTLGAGLGAIDPYLQRFLKGDVVPTLKGIAELARLYKGDLLKLLAPAAVEGAEPMALSVRHRAAELARATDVAHATLKAAGKYFDTRPDAENFDFIDRVETGAKQPTPELQAIHDILRPMLDGRRDAIRALGTGKLQKAIENYFPHLYKDPKTAQQVFENAGKRPLEGSKSFLKKRTIVTLKDAMAAPHNLEPFSANPVDFVLAKVREMDKYLAAHRIFADAKERGQLVAVDARDGQAPFGWKKIDDAMATIYGPSIQQISEYPNEGLHTGLDTVANALGLKQERGFLNLHGAIGRASRAGTVKTLHGTAEDVLAHEIGHQIDFRAGSGKRFVEQYPDAASAARLKQAYKTLKPGSGSTLADRQAARKELKDLAPQIQQRKAFAKELRDLADLRGGRKEYIRKREEKMAQLAQMWVGAREQFERTAPTVFKEWKQFLDQNPKLHALRDIEGNAKVQSLSQPYDVGGLVVKAHWWAPDAAARILNNYLSPGLRDKSAIVRSFLSASNFMNQAQLGFSGFHAAFTLTEAATSHLALAIYQGVNGILDGDARSVAKSFKTAAFAPLAPFTSLMRGHQMLQEWNRPGSQSSLIGQLADAAVIAGGRAKQESFYQTHIGERMMKAWREGNIFGATWRVPFAAFEIPTRLIMEGLVPRLKMGAFADMAEHELARLGPNAEPMDVERALAKVWDSVDNRFGQLVYDDLFWHKYTKDLAMMLVRSPGWNVGDIRELGGGYGDSAKFATLTMKKVAGKGGRPEFTHRMAYIPAHLIVALTLGGLLYYVWHKKAPERLVDWFFPTDEHGQRWSLPTYVKDEFHWATAPLSTAGAKLNPVVPLAKAIATGKDYFGRKIAHAHHYPAELKQWAEYVLTQYEPLWMQQNHHALHRQTTADKILPELGITHAPKALDKHGSSSGSVHLHR